MERENLIVLRTFSKWAGIAGLRLGYYLPEPADAGTVEGQTALQYQRRRDRSRAGLAGAPGGKSNKRWTRWIIERGRLFRELANFPFLRPYPSQANFVLCRVIDRDAKGLKEAWPAKGSCAALRETGVGELYPRQRRSAGADGRLAGGVGRSVARAAARGRMSLWAI